MPGGTVATGVEVTLASGALPFEPGVPLRLGD